MKRCIRIEVTHPRNFRGLSHVKGRQARHVQIFDDLAHIICLDRIGHKPREARLKQRKPCVQRGGIKK